MKPGTPQCSKRVWPSRGWHPHQCDRKGSIERDGKLYCKTHDPVAEKAREAKRDEKYEQDSRERLEKSKRYNAYPRLVEALKRMTSYVESDYRSAKLGDLTGGKLTEAQTLLRELGEQE